MQVDTNAVLDCHRDLVIPLYAYHLRTTETKIDEVEKAFVDALELLGSGKNDAALNLLLEAGITSGRAVALDQARRLDRIYADPDRAKWCAQQPRELIKLRRQRALQAYDSVQKKILLALTTADKKILIKDLHIVAQHFSVLKDAFDTELLNDFPVFVKRHERRAHLTGLAYGVLGSIIAAVLCLWILPMIPGQPKPAVAAESSRIKGAVSTSPVPK